MSDDTELQIHLADAVGAPVGEHVYRLCGIDVTCDLPLPSLASFKAGRRRPHGEPDSRCEPVLSSPAPARYETVGFTGGRERNVVLETGPDGARIEITGFGSYRLAPDGSSIALERLDAPAALALVEECTLGPPLIVALALRDCWFLHAAAVLIDGHTAVIAGPSGSGKSTLAAQLDREPGCRRIADDLIGLRAREGALVALSDYPQLKLAASCQSPHGPVGVETIYLLRPAADGELFGTRKIEKSAKVIALTRHGVAARLFPAGLLDRYLAFCRAAADTVNIVEIIYPHTEPALERAVELVKELDPFAGR